MTSCPELGCKVQRRQRDAFQTDDNPSSHEAHMLYDTRETMSKLGSPDPKLLDFLNFPTLSI